MKKFFIKIKDLMLHHKLLAVICLLAFILFVVLCLMLLSMTISTSNKYGNRLDGIQEVKLTEDRVNEVKEKFEAVDGFTIDKFRLSGRIVNIYITAGDIKKDDVKSEALRLVSSFSEDEIKFYDFQFFVTGPEDNSHYPMIGYKNKNSEGMDWNYEGGN